MAVIGRQVEVNRKKRGARPAVNSSRAPPEIVQIREEVKIARASVCLPPVCLAALTLDESPLGAFHAFFQLPADEDHGEEVWLTSLTHA